MSIEDPRYKKFLVALIHIAKTDWHRKTGLLAQEAYISQGHLSHIINKKKEAPFDKQVAIAKACGYSYESFLQLGQDLIAKEQTPETSTKQHRSIQQTEPEPNKGEVIKMDEDVKIMLQKMIESLEQDKKDLRADLERERQERQELKVIVEELRQENKQLLEQYRALKKEKAQSSQSPDKPEEKKAVNQ